MKNMVESHAYINAKKRLIQMAETMIVNQDDEECVEMVKNATVPTSLLWNEFVGRCPSTRTE